MTFKLLEQIQPFITTLFCRQLLENGILAYRARQLPTVNSFKNHLSQGKRNVP